jgi:regulator of cell morphogenesis and NO signaling
LAEFIADLSEHIRLENDVLFPQFEPGSVAHV